ncbi:MurT ligase domain-containing protein [Bifidobacterium sp. ESL0763]|uniref:Mur ligase family protein n=1 Tax=Bifidobacterium sp. ESL0763 TaxID=2983227 RepID=UPI0023F63377|nr:Mur ligase family protein [Bifidobacterium sp. ESL0763]MDF7664418.1 MurT ligase domain-containing protein [Bifidobacterium sp. ESL0763]
MSMPTTKKPWNAFATPTIGKAVRGLSRLLRHGGSAFPGKVVEAIDPGFLARTLGRLPQGVVLVSGTNGKTTTTRMVASMLRDLGLRVFTNPTGSNFTRGVVSALLTEVSAGGRLDADIAVLELDEAYAVHFVKQVKPRYALLLNVMRDQLDRFGEIDNTARLLGHVAEATTGTVVLNREDRRIAALAGLVPEGTQVRYFGLSDDLRSLFPSDDEMHDGETAGQTRADDGASGAAASSVDGAAQSEDAPRPAAGQPQPDAPGSRRQADVVLASAGDHEASFVMDGEEFDTTVRLEGVYNLFNAAAALAVVRAVTGRRGEPGKAGGDADDQALVRAVSRVTPAFGRGEVITVSGTPVELLLVKNPMGFRLSLASFAPGSHETMIVINDEYADGRDMSWLWDVDFTSLRATGVRQVSGVRAWDMALRLEYDGVEVGRVDPDIPAAVRAFVDVDPAVPKHIYCTYTSMLQVRAALGRLTQVADAGVGR